jgi:hypothetical protein
MPAPWHVGDVWEPQATVTNNAEPPEVVEPGAIAFTVQSPSGAETKPTPTKLKTGVWKAAVKLNAQGSWRLSVSTTAPYEATQPADIYVLPAFGPA